MKKNISVLLVFALILSLFVGIPKPTFAEEGKEVFLSSLGSDENSGTAEAPLRTFRQAFSIPGVKKITLLDDFIADEKNNNGFSADNSFNDSGIYIKKSIVIDGAGHTLYGLFHVFESNLEITIQNLKVIAPKAPAKVYSHCINVGYHLSPSPKNIQLDIINCSLKFAEVDECESYFIAIGFAAVDSSLIIDRTEIHSHICVSMNQASNIIRGDSTHSIERTGLNSSITIKGASALYSNSFIHPEAIPELGISAGSIEYGDAVKLNGDGVTLNLEDGLLTYAKERNPWEVSPTFGILISGNNCTINMSGGLIYNTTSVVGISNMPVLAEGIKNLGENTKINLNGGKIESSGAAVSTFHIADYSILSLNGSELISTKESALSLFSDTLVMTSGLLSGKEGLKIYDTGKSSISLQGGTIAGSENDIFLKKYDSSREKTTLILSDQIKLANRTIYQDAETVFVINDYQSDTTGLENGKQLLYSDIFPNSENVSLSEPLSFIMEHDKLDPTKELDVHSDNFSLTIPAGEVEKLKMAEQPVSITMKEAENSLIVSYSVAVKSGDSEVSIPCVLSLPIEQKAMDGFSLPIISKLENEKSLPLRSYYDPQTQTLTAAITSGDSYAITTKNSSFTDLDGHWAETYAKSLKANGIMEGTGKGSFCPDRVMTRSEAVRLLAVLSGADLDSYAASPFQDVQPTDWFCQSAAWAADQNIVFGVGESRFAPLESVTRGQFAAMLERYAGKETIAAAKVFTVDLEGSITNPSNPLTRAEAAVMLDRLMAYQIRTGIPFSPAAAG